MKTITLEVDGTSHTATLNALSVPEGVSTRRRAKFMDGVREHWEGNELGSLTMDGRTWLGEGLILGPFFAGIAAQFPMRLANFTLRGEQVLYVSFTGQDWLFRIELVAGVVMRQDQVPTKTLEHSIQYDQRRERMILSGRFGLARDESPHQALAVDSDDVVALNFEMSEWSRVLGCTAMPLVGWKAWRAGAVNTGDLRRAAFVAGCLGALTLISGLVAVVLTGGEPEPFYAGGLPAELPSSEEDAPADDQEHPPDELAEAEADAPARRPAAGESTKWDFATFGEVVDDSLWPLLQVSSITWYRDRSGRVRMDVESRDPISRQWGNLARAWPASLGEPPDNARVPSVELVIADTGDLLRIDPGTGHATDIPHRRIVKAIDGGVDVLAAQSRLNFAEVCHLNGGKVVANATEPPLAGCEVMSFQAWRWQRAAALLPPGRLGGAQCEMNAAKNLVGPCTLIFRSLSAGDVS